LTLVLFLYPSTTRYEMLQRGKNLVLQTSSVFVSRSRWWNFLDVPRTRLN